MLTKLVIWFSLFQCLWGMHRV